MAVTPFALTPNPRFLYQGESHRDALAALEYGVRHRRGFTTLIGEVGTGKSTMIHALLEKLADSMRTAVISHSTLDRDEILVMIARGFQLEYMGMSRAELLAGLADFVLDENRSHRPPPVLIIDDAQNLLGEVLEEIRLITNMEVASEKLLQVILAGQEELGEKLAAPSLRQLRQRIAVWAKLQPLSRDDTVSYIKHRLKVAGSNGREFFSEGALQIIYDGAGGVPRLINILCEQSLVRAFGAQLDQVDELRAMEAVVNVGLLPPPVKRKRRRRSQKDRRLAADRRAARERPVAKPKPSRTERLKAARKAVGERKSEPVDDPIAALARDEKLIEYPRPDIGDNGNGRQNVSLDLAEPVPESQTKKVFPGTSASASFI